MDIFKTLYGIWKSLSCGKPRELTLQEKYELILQYYRSPTIVKTLQKHVINKRLQPVVKISGSELTDILNKDPIYNDSRLAWRWWWIFDREYGAISKEDFLDFVEAIKNYDCNVWTCYAAFVATTGLNGVSVSLGIKIKDGETTEEYLDFNSFLVADDDGVKLIHYSPQLKRFVTEKDVICGWCVWG